MSDALQRIIDSKRLPVLFIGSGLSKRYLENFPSWEEFLNNLREQIGISSPAFAAKRHEITSQQPDISTGKLNQKMASYLQTSFLHKIQNNEIDVDKMFSPEENQKCQNEYVDYFKMLLAKSLFTYNVKPSMQSEIDLFKSIAKKISMVFTTNYDMFLQNEIFPDFKVYESQDKYYFRTSNGYGEIYKIHGCISEPNGIVFCEKDYEKFDSTLKLVSSKLINALMDYPIIFIGYSLEDENIKKIMTDFVSCFDDSILQEIKKFMILVVFEDGQNNLVEGEKQFSDEGSGKSITLTTIKTDNFTEIFNCINKLEPSATSYELRKYKTMVAELVNKTAKGEKKVYVQELEESKSDALALYIGSKDSIEGINKSLNIYTNEDIIKFALCNDNFDYDNIAKVWYDSKGIASTQYTPIFLIKSRMSIPLSSCSPKFINNYNDRKDAFEKLKLADFTGNMSTILKKYNDIKCHNRNIDSICSTICQELIKAMFNDSITPDECLDFLKSLLLNHKDAIKTSSFKKVACYAWYLKFEK